MKSSWIIIGMSLLLALNGSATVPEDAQTIVLDQTVEGYAPGDYYKVELLQHGTLAVLLQSVPQEMTARVIIMNEEGVWLASEDASGPGELSTVIAPIDSPGWYWIEVLDLQGNSFDTPYVFTAVLQRTPM